MKEFMAEEHQLMDADFVKESKTRNRRPRTDDDIRNYECGCGKAYLSYPALYTHVKNKHKGVFPDGSLVKKVIKKPEDVFGGQLPAEKKEIYDEVRVYLKYIQDQPDDYEQRQILRRSHLKECYPRNYLTELFDPRNEFESTFIEMMNEDEMKQLHIDGNYKNKKGESKCDEILVYFCLDIAALLEPDFISELIIFLAMMRRAYSEYGRRLKSNFEKDASGNNNSKDPIDFCQEKDISFLPRMANIFIMELFPSYFGQLKNRHELKYLGTTSDKIMNQLFLMKFLCDWLFMNHYTDLKLDINPNKGF